MVSVFSSLNNVVEWCYIIYKKIPKILAHTCRHYIHFGKYRRISHLPNSSLSSIFLSQNYFRVLLLGNNLISNILEKKSLSIWKKHYSKWKVMQSAFWVWKVIKKSLNLKYVITGFYAKNKNKLVAYQHTFSFSQRR